MNWKFWKRNRFLPNTYKKGVDIFPMAALFRWYCYDLCVEDVHDLSLRLGITPISKEAEVEEMQASEERLNRIKPLIPFLDTICQINTGVMLEQNKKMLENLPLEDAQKLRAAELFKANFYAVSMSALVSAFSSGMALDIIRRGSVRTAGLADINEQF